MILLSYRCHVLNFCFCRSVSFFSHCLTEVFSHTIICYIFSMYTPLSIAYHKAKEVFPFSFSFQAHHKWFAQQARRGAKCEVNFCCKKRPWKIHRILSSIRIKHNVKGSRVKRRRKLKGYEVRGIFQK